MHLFGSDPPLSFREAPLAGPTPGDDAVWLAGNRKSRGWTAYGVGREPDVATSPGRRRTSGAPSPAYNSAMHFEDFNVGDTFVTEDVEVTAEDIVEYARRYDPQPFHLDPEAARESIYGGLIASGFHIFSMAFGAIARTGIFEGGGQGAPGIHDVRWVSPARPGDTLRTGIEVLDKRPSRTRADRGYVTMRFDTRNQRGDLVATYTSNQIVLRREPGPA